MHTSVDSTAADAITAAARQVGDHAEVADAVRAQAILQAEQRSLTDELLLADGDRPGRRAAQSPAE